MTLTIEGTTISPGLAQGKLRLHRSLLGSVDAPDNIARDEVDEELSRLDVATEKIGTNDLTQYVFAADRDNAAVDRYFDDAADAIFRLLEISHDDAPGVPLTVCGELAGRPEHIPRLLQCGIHAVSVAPPLLPIIKEAIRGASCDPGPEPLTIPVGDSP